MPTDPRDYTLDLTGGASGDETGDQSSTRPFIGVQFACCGVYTRIYRDADGAAYNGRCPRCGKPVRFAVGAGGTDARMFVVE